MFCMLQFHKSQTGVLIIVNINSQNALMRLVHASIDGICSFLTSETVMGNTFQAAGPFTKR